MKTAVLILILAALTAHGSAFALVAGEEVAAVDAVRSAGNARIESEVSGRSEQRIKAANRDRAVLALRSIQRREAAAVPAFKPGINSDNLTAAGILACAPALMALILAGLTRRALRLRAAEYKAMRRGFVFTDEPTEKVKIPLTQFVAKHRDKFQDIDSKDGIAAVAEVAPPPPIPAPAPVPEPAPHIEHDTSDIPDATPAYDFENLMHSLPRLSSASRCHSVVAFDPFGLNPTRDFYSLLQELNNHTRSGLTLRKVTAVAPRNSVRAAPLKSGVMRIETSVSSDAIPRPRPVFVATPRPTSTVSEAEWIREFEL